MIMFMIIKYKVRHKASKRYVSYNKKGAKKGRQRGTYDTNAGEDDFYSGSSGQA